MAKHSPDIFNTRIIDNQTRREVYASALSTISGAGWESFYDARYTTATPLTLVADTETRALFDENFLDFEQFDNRPLVRGERLPLYDFDTNRIKFYDRHVGGIYKLRLQVTARAVTSGTGIGVEAILRIPSGIAIARQTYPLLKGTNPQRLKFDTILYVTEDEVNNGLEVSIEAINANVEIYNINFLIKAGD